MVDVSAYGMFRRLVIEMDPAGTDSHEHIACPGKVHIQNNFAPEHFPIEFNEKLEQFRFILRPSSNQPQLARHCLT